MKLTTVNLLMAVMMFNNSTVSVNDTFYEFFEGCDGV